ncbi:MAG: head fiber protein [Subdoligranulum sp.]
MGYLSNAGLSYFFGKLKTIFAPISHGHGGATQSAAGFMSAADKKKLDGIAEGANKYSLPTATSNVLGGVKTGANITNNSGVLSVTAANVTNALGYTPPKQDTNTWRPVVNSLTNSATDQSLAANQGKILNESKAAMIVLTNENLNDVVTPGFYSSGGGNNVTNKPSNVDNFGLIVIHQASGNYYTQIVYSDSAAYRRHCVNGTWSGWVQDKLTDTDTWRGIQNNLTSDSTTDSLSAAQGKALKTLVDGKAAMGHTHNSIKDIGNKSSDTTFAYSKAGMSYTDYTWLAGWNGYELRAVNKDQFATAGHTHDASVLINNLSTGDSTPQDDDYYVSQYAGGGTTSTTYYRRPVKALWSYIKGKGDAIYQPKGSYAASNHTHDDRYYTESEIDAKLAGKADSGHIHLQGTESGKVDWNTLKTFGVYKIQSCTMTADYHAPVGEYAFGILQVLDSENGGSENRIIQIYWPHRTSQGAHLWYRMHNSSNMSDGWSNWTAITEKPATAGVADSASSVAWVNVTGKPSTFTPSSHTHNYAGSSSAGGAATSANKVNAALTINLNGTSQGAWDGSSAKSISITAASVGATSVTISRW